MAKKYKFQPGERLIFDNFLRNAPMVQMVENGKLKTTNRFGKGREFIALGHKTDLSGNLFIPENWYQFKDWPVYYDLRQILLDALKKGGTIEMQKAFSQYLINWEKAKKLIALENSTSQQPSEKNEPEQTGHTDSASTDCCPTHQEEGQ